MHRRTCSECLRKKAIIRQLIVECRRLTDRLEAGEEANELLKLEVRELNAVIDKACGKLKK